MSSNKNRFNKSTKTKNWFPYAKYLFITDKHPVRQSQEKCSSSIEALFCQQELEQINGIANSLQCETRDAIRIALFEVLKDTELAHKKTYHKAKSGSTSKGHEGRKTKMRLNLPKAEQVAVEAAKKGQPKQELKLQDSLKAVLMTNYAFSEDMADSICDDTRKKIDGADF